MEPSVNRSVVEKRTPRAAWVALSVFVFFYILNIFDRNLPSLMVPDMKAAFSISDVQVSLILGFSFALFYALCGVPFGWLVDRISRRLVLYIGVTLWSLALAASAFANTFAYFFVARMVLGVGEAALGPAAHSMIADYFPKKRLATALSIYTTGAVLGTGGSIAIGGLAVHYFKTFDEISVPLLGTVPGWQAVFLVMGLPGVLLAFLAFSFAEPPRKHLTAGTRGQLTAFLKSRWKLMLCFTGAFAVMSMAVYGSLLWLPAYMDREFGWGPGLAGPALGVVNIVSAGIGTIGGGVIVDRVLSKGYTDAHLRVFLIAVLIGVPIGIAGYFVPDPYIFLGCVFLLKLLVFSFIGYGAAAIQSVTPSQLRGRMAAFFLLALALIGNGGGPTLIAFLTDNVFADPAKLGLSLAMTLVICAPIALVSAYLGLPLMRKAAALLEAEEQAAATAGEPVS